jgi:hypothetical protein
MDGLPSPQARLSFRERGDCITPKTILGVSEAVPISISAGNSSSLAKSSFEQNATGLFKKRPGASTDLDLSEEAPNRTYTPDKRDTEAKRIVIKGELYKIEVGISPIGEGGQRIYYDVALDTCAGCNILRFNQLPHGAVIRPLNSPPIVSAVQGQPVEVTGGATLRIHLPSIKRWIETDFLIVHQLVVPAVLGTPWIDRYVVSIFPKKKYLLLQIQEDVGREEVRMLSGP